MIEKIATKYLSVIGLIWFISTVQIGCRKDDEPSPATLRDSTAVHDILDNGALATTSVSDPIPGTVLRYGHVWVKSSESAGAPTTSDSKNVISGALPATLNFTGRIFGLTVNTEYKLRAFVETNNGLIYGELKTFTTAPDYVARLVRNLNDSLKNKGFGYSFVVTRNNEIVGEGFGGHQARDIEEGGERFVTVDTKMQIASMTKTLTAAAFLKLASEKGIKTTDKILPYLPKNWTVGPNIDQISFRDLLLHQSGITGFNDICQNGAVGENGWYGLQLLIEKGIRLENRGRQCYQNANYGLFRVLIPAMLGFQFSDDNYADDHGTRQSYEKYLKEEILGKLGVSSSGILVNSATSPTFGYDFPYSQGTKGFDPGDFRNAAGGYGVYLSAREAAKVYSGLFSTTDASILSAALKDSIITRGMGSYSSVTPQGKFSYHDGWWQSGLSTGKAKGFRSLWMKCPDDITVVIFTNALRHGDGLFPIRSDFYSDITSYVLWAFSDIRTSENGRSQAVNFHQYLQDPQPH
ncbi:serine hydrolase [Dyadobacter sp. CY312]|uniref:serine hydrolase domain-containing protein n=1 Tax=Dyadobacter sp. CY312 TaxID=2907303 RepID=UPI001F3D3C3A|nr:serine hydrolase domain-containing protein [Dyadobacter sp. CY312]MCE7043222.1 beta-lactamase family protein [Dyadobacter sp. CY312]